MKDIALRLFYKRDENRVYITDDIGQPAGEPGNFEAPLLSILGNADHVIGLDMEQFKNAIEEAYPS